MFALDFLFIVKHQNECNDFGIWETFWSDVEKEEGQFFLILVRKYSSIMTIIYECCN